MFFWIRGILKIDKKQSEHSDSQKDEKCMRNRFESAKHAEDSKEGSSVEKKTIKAQDILSLIAQ